jgi:16S rRNA (guanine527-N7)-methyltransferase
VSEPTPGERDAALCTLREAAARLGAPGGGLETLVAYVAAVIDENERINLTGAKSLAIAIDVLAVDALPLASAWGAGPPPRRIVDLGTGNGLPGVAAALFWPQAETILVERREKKARAVERCLARAGLARVAVVACDGRELLSRRPQLARGVDLVTVRAVGDLAPTTREATPWLARRGRIVHWKAGGLDAAELAAGRETARALGLGVLPDVEFTLASGAARRLVTFTAP